MTFQPSKYQATILDWVEHGEGSAIVDAKAGSGKTKTIELALPKIPEWRTVQLFAFNATIAKELNARIVKLREETGRGFVNVRASTFHSLGYGAILRYLGLAPSSMQVDGSKVYRICQEHLSGLDFAMYGDYVAKLVGFAKGEGIGPLVPDSDPAWWSLIKHHDLAFDSDKATEKRAIEIARKVLEESNRIAKTGLIDFNDQLYLPLAWELRLRQNDWVFIDEAQDTNPVRRALAKLALMPGGRLMAVGDPHQGIYGFTGASHDAMEIIAEEFNTITMPLSVSYRCSKAVIRMAQTLVPDIESWDGAPEGLVETMSANDALKVLDSHDAILCRQNAPLISLAFQLIGEGRACVVLGRDIGVGLKKLIQKMKAKDIETLSTRLLEHCKAEVAKFMGRGEEGKAEQISDRVSCIMTIIDNLDKKRASVSGLLMRIDDIFSDSSNALTLASIHKAKGKEWRRVGVLHPHLMPSKWARQAWQQKQEKNAQYVAYTRAMEHMIFIPKDARDKKVSIEQQLKEAFAIEPILEGGDADEIIID